MGGDSVPSGRRRLYAAVLVILVLVGVIAALYLFYVPQRSAPSPAPDFTVTDIDGNTITLSQYRGQRVVVLDFMATWCGSCKIVEKNLKVIHHEYNSSVEIISIDIDPRETDDLLRAYRDDNGIPWAIARDTDDLMLKYGVEEISAIVIIDAQGYPIYRNKGVTSVEDLRTHVEHALAGEAAPIDIQQVSIVTLAVIAGVASFFSPCAFPMLPGYMTTYLEMERKRVEREQGRHAGKGRAILAGGAAALGIVVVYGVVGIAVILAAGAVTPYVPLLQPIVGVVLIVLGALMLTNIQYWQIVRPFQALGRMLRGARGDAVVDPTENKEEGYYSRLFGYGVGYGAAAAGCVAPVFVAVILVAMLGSSVWSGVFVLLLYSLTAAALMIAVTVLIASASRTAVNKLKRYTPLIKKISAVALILVGVYLVAFFYLAWVAD